MADFMIKVDEHTPMLIKALIKHSGFRQCYFAKELGIKESNLSAYLSGKKQLPKELRDRLLTLIGFNPKLPYILITQDENKLLRRA